MFNTFLFYYVNFKTWICTLLGLEVLQLENSVCSYEIEKKNRGNKTLWIIIYNVLYM